MDQSAFRTILILNLFLNLSNIPNVSDPPDPPDIKAVSRILSINITWCSLMEDSKIEILDYRIKVLDGITNRQEKQYTRRRTTSLLIENLKRNKTYIVAIQARNEAGYGEFANISATTLLAGTPNCYSLGSKGFKNKC